MLVHHAGNSSDRQVLGELHNQAFKKESEAGTFPRPGYTDGLNAMLAALDAWQVGMYVSLVLKEVEMTPASRLSVVGSGFNFAFRAGKLAALRKGDFYMKFHSSG